MSIFEDAFLFTDGDGDEMRRAELNFGNEPVDFFRNDELPPDVDQEINKLLEGF